MPRQGTDPRGYGDRLAIDIRTDAAPRAPGSRFVFEQTFRLCTCAADPA